MTFRPAIFDSDVLPFNIANLTQSLAECVDSGRRFTWRSAAEKTNPWVRRLLRPRRERPSRRATQQRDELAALYVEHGRTSSPMPISAQTGPFGRFTARSDCLRAEARSLGQT